MAGRYVGQPVRRIDAAANALELQDGTRLEYDYLVITTGPKLAFDEVPGDEFVEDDTDPDDDDTDDELDGDDTDDELDGDDTDDELDEDPVLPSDVTDRTTPRITRTTEEGQQ